MTIEEFQKTVWDYYIQHRRDMPWRNPESNGAYDPYKIMVSEIMLQQTQVARVISKYILFLSLFPTVTKLAEAPLSEVLAAWSGLGYNRRARFLWQAAIHITSEYKGIFPRDEADLVRLPGIGINTAAAICAYAYDMPVVFVETNIRTVYIHHFFEDQTGVRDKDISDMVQRTLPDKNFRDWYYALMDYGAFLKSNTRDINTRAQSYAKQSIFKGSKRQVRGNVLRLLRNGPSTHVVLAQNVTDERLSVVLRELEREGLIHSTHDQIFLG